MDTNQVINKTEHRQETQHNPSVDPEKISAYHGQLSYTFSAEHSLLTEYSGGQRGLDDG